MTDDSASAGRNSRILLLEGIHPSAEKYLRGKGFTNVTSSPGALDAAQLRAAVAGAHLLGIRSRTRIDAEGIAAAPGLLAIGCFCIGTNQVDLRAAAFAGVPVFNAPHSNTRSVAELVIGFAVMLIRDVHRKSLAAHAGRWMKTTGQSQELRGKTLGIVGYGHIGSQVSVLAESLGMTVLYHDIEVKLPLGNARPQPTLSDVLRKADIVTLHVPDTAQTRGLISAERLAEMRPGALLVNTSRGSVVDLAALAARLRSGALGGAAIDVFPSEPPTNDAPFESPLRGIENVILSPHVAGSTLEAQENIGVEVARKLANYVLRGATPGAVNFPALPLQEPAGGYRILHVHRNVPGVVRSLNVLVADAGLNIAGVSLQTQGEIGYAAIDVEGEPTPALAAAVAAVPATVRSRIVRP